MAASNLSSIRRQVKNVAYNYSDTQVKVREATSNDPWGPSSSLMSEIADLTNNAVAFTEIMQMLWKRLNDKNKNWRHVYKSLVLMDYLIKCGSERVAQQCKENIYSIETLRSFQHIEDNKDQGHNVRQKATQIVNLIKDDERLKSERTRAIQARKRFVQNSMGIASDGSHRRMHQGTSADGIDEARPTSVGEEEMQLQIALALSREEAAKEEEARKGDDVRLQMAIDESRTGGSDAGTSAPHHQGATADSIIDDLLSLGIGQPVVQSAPTAGGGQVDAWGAPIAPPASTNNADPWGGTNGHSTTAAAAANDPWGGSATNNTLNSTSVSANNDPWSTSAPGAPTMMPPAAQQQSMSTLDALMGDAPLQPMGGDERADALKDARKTTKTPDTFLGANSNLVNLDELLGPAQPAKPAQTRSTSANPFLSATTPAAATTANPFTAAARPSPTLNEMRAQTTTMALGAEAANMTGGDWSSTLPAPLQPARAQPSQPAPTNPFL